MKQLVFLLTLILITGQLTFAQESKSIGLSLQQCIQMAVENNINVRTACIDKEESKFKVEETRAMLLPKINMAGSFQDNTSLPTTVIPGSFIGQPGTDVAMQMGSRFNSGASVSISQVLYNRTAILALDIARESEDVSGLNIEKAKEDIAAKVARLYFLTLTTAEQQKLIEGNIARAEKLKNITKVTVDNGLGNQVDLDRVSVNLENYYTQLSNAQSTQEQQLSMMKYLLSLPQQQSINLTDKVDTLLLRCAPALVSDFSDNTDIRLLESQQEINLLKEKAVRSESMPTLSFSGLYSYQGLESEFKDYFSSNNKWYPYSYFSVSLSIPIFNGFAKHAKSHQASLEYQKTQEKLDATKESFTMNYKNAINNYMNNKNIVYRQQENLKLAERVYEETALKYREGFATMSNLLQDEISLSNAQAGYLNALYNFRDAEVNIMSIDGGIKNLYTE